MDAQSILSVLNIIPGFYKGRSKDLRCINIVFHLKVFLGNPLYCLIFLTLKASYAPKTLSVLLTHV